MGSGDFSSIAGLAPSGTLCSAPPALGRSVLKFSVISSDGGLWRERGAAGATWVGRRREGGGGGAVERAAVGRGAGLGG